MKKIFVRLSLFAIALTILLTLSACSDKPADKGASNTGDTKTEQGSETAPGDVTNPDDTTPQGTEPVGTEPVGTESADTEPVETEPEEPEPDIYDANGKLISKEEFLAQKRLVIYPDLHEDINRSYDYRVSVSMGGKARPLTVYNHTMEYSIFGRSIGSDVVRRFTRFAFSGGQVRVDIKVSRDFEAYSVIPSAKKFKSEFKNGIISVYLDKPDYFLIRLDNDDNSLISVCADYPEYPGDIPSKDDPNVLYIDGWYESETGLMDITTPNTIVYVEPQAVLNCRVKFTKDAVGSKMFGRGAVLDPFGDIYNYKIRDGGTEGSSYKLTTMSCADGYLEGLFFLDTRAYNIAVNADRIKVENVKCFSTLMTTDGISVYSGKGAQINHCLLYVGDNALVYSTIDTVFTDITIGTTCAALFPQASTTNNLLDGIYIFRTNDGVINNTYNGDQSKERVHSNIIRNLDCMDCINIPHFFKGIKMGVLEKTFTFENVSIPRLSGVTDPHIGLVEDRGGKLFILDNGDGMIYTDNYTLKFVNFYIDGELLEDIEDVSFTDRGKENEIIIEEGEVPYRQIYRQWNVIKHKATGVTYIGNYRFSPEHEPVTKGGTVYFPTANMLKTLRRADAKPETIDINGVKYSTGDAFVKAKAAESFEIKNGNYFFVPCYDGEELLLADEGEISRFSEAGSYQVDMEVENWNGDTVYVMYDHNNYFTGGVSRMITEEIKMYGEGKYRLSFDLCGYGSGTVNVNVKYDNYHETCSLVSKQASYLREWDSFSFDFMITKNMTDCEGALFSITGTSNSKLPFYALKNFSLVKVG